MFKKCFVTLLAVCPLLLLAACSSGSSGASACPSLAPPAAAAGSLAATVDDLVGAAMKSLSLPGLQLTLSEKGVVVYSQAYGYADVASCRPVSTSTPFRIGSVTKQFTAAAILQLYGSGALNIDNPVTSYLPAYPFDARITPRMLLNQTSGLQNYLAFPAAASWAGGVARSTVLVQIAQTPLLFAPGSAYAYSNSNYFVLGAVVEAVSGQIYPDYMTGHIFQPLGLTHTSYSQPAGSATSYISASGPATPGDAVTPFDPSMPFSAGALWSTTEDLASWDAALRNGQVVPAALLVVMTTPPASVPVFQASSMSTYAMGWAIASTLGHPDAWHDGAIDGFVALNGMFLDDGTSLSILANFDTPQASTAGSLVVFGFNVTQQVCGPASSAANC